MLKNPEISCDTLLSYFRRLMGCLNLLSHTEKGKDTWLLPLVF